MLGNLSRLVNVRRSRLLLARVQVAGSSDVSVAVESN